MYYNNYDNLRELCRYDMILMGTRGSRKLSMSQLREIVRVNVFKILGTRSVGKYRGRNFMRYLKDKKVRAPSDHLGLYT
jgi:hypothetical protein